MSGQPEGGSAKKPSVVGTAVLTALPAALAVALFVLLVRVPAQKKTFDDFQMKLPEPTVQVITVSMWVADYWWVLVPVGLVLLFAAGVATAVLRHTLHRPGLAAVWVLVQSLPLLIVCAYVWFAMTLPMQRLREGLSK